MHLQTQFCYRIVTIKQVTGSLLKIDRINA